MEHIEAVQLEQSHGCCDEGETENEDCLDKCLSGFSEIKSPDSELAEKKISSDITFPEKWIIQHLELHESLNNNEYAEIVFDPPRQWNYVGITKKVE